MGLITVQNVQVLPNRITDYEEAVQEVAAKARKTGDDQRWACRQTVAGELGRYAFIVNSENWAEQSRVEPSDVLVRRLLGEDKGKKIIERLRDSATSAELMVARDRPELSYAEGIDPERQKPLSVVARIQCQPGRQEACEELLRKLAEAIPKTDDPRRFITYQAVVGDLSLMATVTPLDDLGELDESLPPDQLLLEAFGAGEGGLIFRNGLDAMQTAERSIVALREDLSNL